MTLSRWVEGREIAVEAERIAHEVGDDVAYQRARVMAAEATVLTQSDATLDELRVVVDEAQPVLERAGHDRGLAEVWIARGTTGIASARYAEAKRAIERARQYALDAGIVALAEYAAMQIAQTMTWGSTPTREAVARCDELMEESRTRRGRFMIAESRATMLGFLGRFDEAEAETAAAHRGLDEVTGGLVPWSNVGLALLARARGDAPRAVELLMEGRANRERVGDFGSQSTIEAELSLALASLGRDDDAIAMSDESERHASSDDAASQLGLHTGRGLALGHLGQIEAALENLSKALAIASQTDFLNGHAQAFEAQAEVLRLAGRNEEASRALDQAVELYRSKENVAALRRLGVDTAAAS
jgi:tetratricopeptide (TPR) repeat protein